MNTTAIFEPVGHESLADAVVSQIEDLIASGILKQGRKLPSERDLAEMLRVSRPKLREALQVLEERGLVTTQHGEGTFVAALTGQAMMPALLALYERHEPAFFDYLEYRREQEGFAARLAARRATKADKERISEILDENERAWQEQGGAAPGVMAGHSLGEFSALVCADALGFADAVKLVRSRGEFMQSAVPVGEGAMAAIIGVDDADIERICEETSDGETAIVSAVNYNSPGQVVIAGHTGAVDAAIEALKAAGAKRAMPLPVSAPFHTSLMRPAGERLAEAIAGMAIASPGIPVVHNVHAATESDPEKIRALLVQQIYSPVRWTSCVQTMVSAGVQRVVECGPGKVLSGLNRRIDKSLASFNLEEPEALEAARAELA